jgi:hypothetical protein
VYGEDAYPIAVDEASVAGLSGTAGGMAEDDDWTVDMPTGVVVAVTPEMGAIFVVGNEAADDSGARSQGFGGETILKRTRWCDKCDT